MQAINLDAQVREMAKSAKFTRRENLIPAEYYGEGVENLHLALDYQSFRKVFKEAGENTVINLKIGSGKEIKVLVQDVQYDPVSDKFIHIDFINVDMNKEVNAMIPLKFFGEAPAVKNLSGILTTPKDEIEVRCLPADLIKEIEVDVSVLVDFDSYIRVKDLTIPESVTVADDPEQMVATVVPPKIEAEEPVKTPEEDAAKMLAPEEGKAEGAEAPKAEGGAGQGQEKKK